MTKLDVFYLNLFNLLKSKKKFDFNYEIISFFAYGLKSLFFDLRYILNQWSKFCSENCFRMLKLLYLQNNIDILLDINFCKNLG